MAALELEQMVSVEEGNRRLLILATFLDTLPRERFDYTRWYGPNWKGALDLSCGTTACAMGWAPVVPELKVLGLRLEIASTWKHAESDIQHFEPVVTCPALGVGYDPASDDYYHSDPESVTMRAGRAFFALSSPEASFLFIPQSTMIGDRIGGPARDATPQEVADHIRDFVHDRRVADNAKS